MLNIYLKLVGVIIMYIYSFTEKIIFKNATSPQEFSEGEDAVIVCDVLSSPPPTVMWKHKKAKIQFDKDGMTRSVYFPFFSITVIISIDCILNVSLNALGAYFSLFTNHQGNQLSTLLLGFVLLFLY